MVKLNPVRDYIAYGTDDGFIRVERISKVMVGRYEALVHNLCPFSSQINRIYPDKN